MPDFSMPCAVFTLIIVIADIIMALTLCFSLPYHASRLHYYPPYGRIVDVDTATIHCPCLNKYLEEFRGKIDVKFVRPQKNSNRSTALQLKSRRSIIEKYPFMASIHEHGKFICEGYLTTNGMVVFSQHCDIDENDYSALTVRTGSPYINKLGRVHKVLEVGETDYLFYVSIFPGMSSYEARTKGVGINLMTYSVPKESDILAVHSWSINHKVNDSPPVDVLFRTYLYLPTQKCEHQRHVQFCYGDMKQPESFHMVLNHCKKTVVALKFEITQNNSTTNDKKTCNIMYAGSCMNAEEETNYCKNREKELMRNNYPMG